MKKEKKQRMRGKKNSKRKAITLKKIIKDAGTAMKKEKPISIDSAIKAALISVNKSKSGKLVKPQQRIIKMPSISGGVLPLKPIFAGLSALGSIVGSTTSILKAINEYKDAHKQLEESKRHNQTMESIAMGKGFYLRPYNSGRGFYLKPYPKKLLNTLPERPLTNYDIIEYIKQIKIPHFRGVYMRDNLPKSGPKKNECMIINHDSVENPGTHWTSYVKTDKNVYYFDSYGKLPPPLELMNYLGSGCNIYCNYKRFQKFGTVICGHLCLQFLYEFHYEK